MKLSHTRDVLHALANPDIRRVEGAFAGFNVTESGSWITMMVFAYGVGGATAAGVMGALLLVPAIFVAPLASTLGDRIRRDQVLAGGYAALALFTCAAGVVMMAGAPLIVIYPFAAISASATALPRPVQSAMLPSLARTPHELTAANVLAGWLFALGILCGPLVVAAVLFVSTPGAALVVLGVVSGFSCLAILRVTRQPPPAAARLAEVREDAHSDILAGLREIAAQPRYALVISLLTANFVIDGTIDVLLVIVSVRLMHAGNAGVGLLMAAVGIGSFLGAGASLVLLARQQVRHPLLLGALAWGVGLGFIGFAPSRVLIPLLAMVAGAGRPLMDISGRLLLQRVVRDAVQSRVFGVLEGLTEGAFGLGMLAVPVLFNLFNSTTAFIAIGIFLPTLVLVSWGALRRLDASTVVPQAALDLLQSSRLFASLSPVIVERMAMRLIPVEVRAGAVVILEGELGDRFYIIRDGQATVLAGKTPVATLERGEFFGEIALLRDVPRTATVEASSDLRLYALERDDFLEAITGQPQSKQAADAVTDQRLLELAGVRGD